MIGILVSRALGFRIIRQKKIHQKSKREVPLEIKEIMHIQSKSKRQINTTKIIGRNKKSNLRKRKKKVLIGIRKKMKNLRILKLIILKFKKLSSHQKQMRKYNNNCLNVKNQSS